MIVFFKNKPFLRDLISDNYIDIHSHLLPEIDDGSKSYENTFELINKLEDFGTCQFITTPHVINGIWNNTNNQIIEKHKETVAALKENNIFIPFNVAAEYMIDDEFAKLFKKEKLLTLKDNYVLVEMSYVNSPMQLYEILFDLQIAGYIPVLAHPERYFFYHNNFNEYTKLKKSGCLFQLNLLSVIGYYGEGVSKICDKLLYNNMYDFVGSDVHHENHLAGFNARVLVKSLKSLKSVISNNQFFKIE